jgi:hypothetical protein
VAILFRPFGFHGSNDFSIKITAKTRTKQWSRGTPTKIECDARLSGRG